MTDAVIVAVVGAVPAVLALVAGLANGRKAAKNATAITELHLLINSRLSELLALTASASHAEGLAAGRQGTAEEAAAAREVVERVAEARAKVLGGEERR